MCRGMRARWVNMWSGKRWRCRDGLALAEGERLLEVVPRVVGRVARVEDRLGEGEEAVEGDSDKIKGLRLKQCFVKKV